MTHIKPLTRTPELGQIDVLESLVLAVLGIFFRDFDNVQQVVGSLQKFFSKTPS